MNPHKTRPILLSGSMVRAILSGGKTQTRRIIKPQPSHTYWSRIPGYELIHTMHHAAHGSGTGMAHRWWHSIPTNPERDPATPCVFCPYGQPGDRLWVREAWAKVQPLCLPWPQTTIVYREGYNSTEYVGPWKPSIHMPRWASRITLEITSVHAERLQSISEDDARAEGVLDWAASLATDPAVTEAHIQAMADTYGSGSLRAGYAALWDEINGPGSWDANPWVWVVQFKRVQP